MMTIEKSVLNKIDFLKIATFFIFNYLIAGSLTFYLLNFLGIQTLSQTFLLIMLATMLLLVLFTLTFCSIKLWWQRLLFSICWAFSSAFLLEFIALLFVPQKIYQSTPIFILLGDWTVLLPIWIILGIIDFALANFLLEPISKLKPSKNTWIYKLLINLWLTFAIAFNVSSLETLGKLSIILILMNAGLIFIFSKIKNSNKRKNCSIYAISFFTFIFLTINLTIFVYNDSFKEYAYLSIPYVSLITFAYLSPVILFTFIVNYKLYAINKYNLPLKQP